MTSNAVCICRIYQYTYDMTTEDLNNFETIEEEPEAAVEEVRSETFKHTEKALKKAQKGGEAVDVADVEIADPAAAYENLKTALMIVNKHFKVSMDDLYFKKFEGATVGEALGDGVEVDPIMLMHPAHRLAHVIMHELAHKGGDIENEGAVEAYTRLMMEKSGLGDDDFLTTPAYDDAVGSFHEFAEKVSGGKDLAVMVEKIYKLYYSENYESIYEMYERCCMKGSDEENAEAFRFFEKVFPELKVNQDGWYKTCTDDEEIPESAE